MFGIFDSGVGGLSAVRLIEKLFADAGFTYLGDTAHFPYGEKSEETIKKLASQNASFLVSRGAKFIVIACNTASALAADSLSSEWENKGIMVYDVITPTIEKISHMNIKKLGVIGTRGTIRSKIYEKKLSDKNIKIISRCYQF
jgi:glutamate racemase